MGSPERGEPDRHRLETCATRARCSDEALTLAADPEEAEQRDEPRSDERMAPELQKDSPVNGTSAPVFRLMSDS
jgi:hypothetical protein